MKSKYAEYAYYLTQGKINTYIVPPSIEIDFTNACNQDCTYCNVVEFRNAVHDKTKIHDYHTLIERVSTWSSYRANSIGNVNTITFVGGGEPTARKGYEYVVEQAVDTGILVSIITNGSGLDKLFNINTNTIRKLSWIGVDIDSGDPEIYEKVRRSKKSGLYEKVKENIKSLTKLGVNVDIKSLLFNDTISKHSIKSTLLYCKEVGARQVYFRLALLNKELFIPNPGLEDYITALGKELNVKVLINTSRMGERNYKKCHALHLIPIFSADSNVYTCCEDRGNDFFNLCDWVKTDFRDEWMGPKHKHMYDTLDLATCAPCRPHTHNVQIQNMIDKSSYVQDLFF